MPHAQGVNVDTITSRCTREPRKLSATAIAVSFTSPDYGALGISPQTTLPAEDPQLCTLDRQGEPSETSARNNPPRRYI